MKSPKYASTANYDERVTIALPAEMKARVFQIATQRGLPASAFLRQAIAAAADGAQAA